MEETKIRLLEESWARAEAHGGPLAEAFYGRLFELEPKLQDLFAVTEMGSQNEKFQLMMGELVRCAGQPDRLRALLVESGRRHRDYGVMPRDYLVVGEAFLWALHHSLSGGLSREEREAWAEAYTFMSSVMRGA